MTLEERAFEIISKKLTVPVDRINLQTHLVNDLGADSLNLIDLIMEFEDRFDIDIDDNTMESFHTVKDIIDHLHTRIHSCQ